MGVRGAVGAVVVVLVAALGLVPGAAPPAAAAERYRDRVFTDVVTTVDLTYGAAPDEHGRTQSLELDLFRPAGDTATRRPALVLAYGGGFAAGQKSDMGGWGRRFAQRGFVVASIEYRMDEAAGEVFYPLDARDLERVHDAREDMQAAVRWLRSRSVALGIDPGRIAVGGLSAGGITALLTATMPDVPGQSGTPGLSSRVCTALSWAGAGDPALVDSGDAGAYFVHGDLDTRVPYPLAVATEAAMRRAGLRSRLVTLPGRAHSVGDLVALEQGSADWLADVVVDRATGCTGPGDPTAAAFVRAAHADLLGRGPSADELQQAVDLLGSGATRRAVLWDLTTSVEWVSGIVRGFYEDTLGRVPDAQGLAYWTDQIRSGRLSVARVAASFYASPEHYGRGDPFDWIRGLYAAVLGRAIGPDEVDHWLAEAAAHGRTAVAGHIYASIESRRSRVAGLYQHLLGRAPEPAGRDYWAARVATQGDLVLARDLAASDEYGARAVRRFP